VQYTQNLNYLFCIFADWDVYNVSASCGLEYLIWDSRTPTVSVTRSVEPCESVCGLLTESWIGCWAVVMWSVDLYGLASQMSNTPFTRDQSVWARGRGRFAALPLQLLCLLELIARLPACLPGMWTTAPEGQKTYTEASLLLWRGFESVRISMQQYGWRRKHKSDEMRTRVDRGVLTRDRQLLKFNF